jgi:hypothetical protein
MITYQNPKTGAVLPVSSLVAQHVETNQHTADAVDRNFVAVIRSLSGGGGVLPPPGSTVLASATTVDGGFTIPAPWSLSPTDPAKTTVNLATAVSVAGASPSPVAGAMVAVPDDNPRVALFCASFASDHDGGGAAISEDLHLRLICCIADPGAATLPALPVPPWQQIGISHPVCVSKRRVALSSAATFAWAVPANSAGKVCTVFAVVAAENAALVAAGGGAEQLLSVSAQIVV